MSLSELARIKLESAQATGAQRGTEWGISVLQLKDLQSTGITFRRQELDVLPDADGRPGVIYDNTEAG